MIYTTYFAQLRKLPDFIIPISICGKCPEWYRGIQYKKLAPKYDFFQEWKANHDNDKYIQCFNEKILNLLDADKVVKELYMLAGIGEEARDKYKIALVCYEKPDDFCHRHLVADWLNKNGYKAEELNI